MKIEKSKPRKNVTELVSGQGSASYGEAYVSKLNGRFCGALIPVATD